MISLIFYSLTLFATTHSLAWGSAPTICKEIDRSVKNLHWKLPPCAQLAEWKIAGKSVQGRPLIYADLGEASAKNTTLIVSMVHGDEVTPLFLGLKVIDWIKTQNLTKLGARVIVAPFVNPDSFYKRPRTRVNARGVDLNRNLGTSDWNKKALNVWKTKFKSDPRRFPGQTSDSEPETLFQKELIERFAPQKIISIHAPLNFLDYDGPTTLSLSHFPKEYVEQCLLLSKKVKAKSSGYFIGSLGNFAGNEKGIPTFTLELPSANPNKAWEYWRVFQNGIKTVIQHDVSLNAADR